jgi:ribonuclease HI
MAEAAWQQDYEACRGKPVQSQQWLFVPNPPVTPCVCVDAACAGVPGPVEYQGVHLPDEKVLFRQGPFPNGTNNIGEFLAIVHALAWLEQNGLDEPVYSDSRTAISWVWKGRCGTEHPLPEGSRLAELVTRAEAWLAAHPAAAERVRKWDTEAWGEIPADFGRK